MNWGSFAAFVLFAAAMVLTPGPNNMIAVAQGARFGIARTLPFLAGAVSGFVLLVAILFAGGAALLAAAPGLIAALTILGAGYLLWLAWRIGSADPAAAGPASAGPMSFGETILIQWLNPKSWMTALAATGAYSDMVRSPLAFAAIGVLVFATLMFPAMLLWTAGGAALGRLGPRAVRLVNRFMAALIVVSVGLMLAR